MPRTRLTPETSERLREAQAHVDATEDAYSKAVIARNELLRVYHAEPHNVGVSELAREIGKHRSQVNRITVETGDSHAP